MEWPPRVCRAFIAATAGLPLIPLSGLGWTTEGILTYFVVLFLILVLVDPN